MKEDLLKKYNLEEVQKRFQQICEYKFGIPMAEAEDNMQQQDNQQQPQQPMDNGTDGEMPMDNQQQPMGGDPNMDGQQPPMDNGMGGNMPMGDEMSGDMGNGMQMEDPMANNIDQMQPDDEVIDVDELTQSQETTEYKIDGVNDKLTALMSVLPKFIEALNQNDEKINDLKTEIEKRNPTAEEQMNIRSQASYPYTESPKGYWEEKMKENPHYDVIYNNDVSPKDEQEEFTLHKDELGNYNDQDLAKSFEYPMELKDILKF